MNQTAGLGKKALPHVPDSQKPESCCFFRNVNPISHTAVKIGIHRCSPRRGKIRTVALCEIGFIYFHDLKKKLFFQTVKNILCVKKVFCWFCSVINSGLRNWYIKAQKATFAQRKTTNFTQTKWRIGQSEALVDSCRLRRGLYLYLR